MRGYLLLLCLLTADVAIADDCYRVYREPEVDVSGVDEPRRDLATRRARQEYRAAIEDAREFKAWRQADASASALPEALVTDRMRRAEELAGNLLDLGVDPAQPQINAALAGLAQGHEVSWVQSGGSACAARNACEAKVAQLGQRVGHTNADGFRLLWEPGKLCSMRLWTATEAVYVAEVECGL